MSVPGVEYEIEREKLNTCACDSETCCLGRWYADLSKVSRETCWSLCTCEECRPETKKRPR
jgi:hypothetical protein